MQTSFPTAQRKRALRLVLAALSFAMLVMTATDSPAQQLAHPGWAGFHTQSEAWWRHAVFYHIEPSMFQDSDGDGRGDLRGIALRMDYLQSLGIDAILLDVPANDAGFDDLLQEASRHHIRIVVEIYADSTDAPSIARLWLTRGAAGLYAHIATAADPAAMLAQLQKLVSSFPGQRLLLSDAVAPKAAPLHLGEASHTSSETETRTSHSRSRHRHSVVPATPAETNGETTSAGLTLAPLTGQFGDTDATLENSLQLAEALPGDALPLLSTEDDGRSADRFPASTAAQKRSANAALAAMLLASRGAALLEYGQELGMQLPVNFDGNVPMPWTPENHSATPLEAAPTPKGEDGANAGPATSKPPQEIFGEYHPYVPPKLKKKSDDPSDPVDPNTLPGFTTATLPQAIAANEATANVALEESERDSLLHLYRRLLQLHHDNPSLLSGTQQMLSAGGQPAIAWLRRAPEGTLTASSVIVACNFSTRPVVLSLGHELTRVGIRSRSLRTLLSSTGSTSQRSVDQLTLAPGELYLGEVTR